MAVCDSRVLLRAYGRKTLYVFDVSTAHTLRAAASVPLPNAFYRLACTRRDGDTLVVFTYWNETSSVSLQRLALLPLRLERQRRLLLDIFQRRPADFHKLALRHANAWHRVAALVGQRAHWARALLDTQAGDKMAWTIVRDGLVLFDWDSKDLLSYELLSGRNSWDWIRLNTSNWRERTTEKSNAITETTWSHSVWLETSDMAYFNNASLFSALRDSNSVIIELL